MKKVLSLYRFCRTDVFVKLFQVYNSSIWTFYKTILQIVQQQVFLKVIQTDEVHLEKCKTFLHCFINWNFAKWKSDLIFWQVFVSSFNFGKFYRSKIEFRGCNSSSENDNWVCVFVSRGM